MKLGHEMVCVLLYVPGVCFPHGNGNATDTMCGFHVPILSCRLQLIVETQHQRHQVQKSINVPAHKCSK